ncbi:hypothetical protein PHYBLDRAFT_145875 [Phycomyces blakesleeanus NRRL 1555(-)]|uniref:Uncharacterized protein n=1 Tax=Phycomyces blakesleeanus (strain ATCC 8743b / DSM 1359 / FGSC 10004 / NBRC 33097 / NRRL 1555) TaxID=763407 RepID=A0A167MPW3_PHYB8|nr:hypothetical protein PHYBLDRAFT_145875 [Phycomyces blakesleeanus NRRL 1555(-)]OAD73484.1 hypothetical protein PHYBLDRAFT_145875 [Phycomyces blakesleeanus NRRL 1555(-)]|eukprot:XP_018291524.1 hypothetical protein PHYBLDRAFT_145875 [Phycomyces blakesleeanus NRRL 1555(-)]
MAYKSRFTEHFDVPAQWTDLSPSTTNASHPEDHQPSRMGSFDSIGKPPSLTHTSSGSAFSSSSNSSSSRPSNRNSNQSDTDLSSSEDHHSNPIIKFKRFLTTIGPKKYRSNKSRSSNPSSKNLF